MNCNWNSVPKENDKWKGTIESVDSSSSSDSDDEPRKARARPNPAQEKAAIQELLAKHEKKEGEIYFPISIKWYDDWEAYVQRGRNRPMNHMNVYDIVDRNSNLSVHPETFQMFPKKVYEKYVEWYGRPKLEFPRFVRRFDDDKPEILIYPITYHFYTRKNFKMSKALGTIELKDGLDLQQIKKVIREQFRVDEPSAVFLRHYASDTPKEFKQYFTAFTNPEKEIIFDYGGEQPEADLLKDFYNNLTTNKFVDLLFPETASYYEAWITEITENEIVLDCLHQVERIDKGSMKTRIFPPYSYTPGFRDFATGDLVKLFSVYEGWKEVKVTSVDNMVHLRKSEYNTDQLVDSSSRVLAAPFIEVRKKDQITSNRTAYSSYGYSQSHDRGSAPGVCGLSNLGNTCFMNSMLQCLLHCEPLIRYFLGEFQDSHVYRTNPLGTGGRLADEFANLTRDIWSGEHSFISPSALKYAIGHFAHQFSGYQQQDSFELGNYVIDGLNEDLYRPKTKKPYILIELEGKPLEEAAEICSSAMRRRNDSPIMDIFGGMTHTHLVCPKCSHAAEAFDPSYSLSVPLPMNKEVIHTVLFHSLDYMKRPLRLKVKSSDMTIGTMKSEVSKMLNIPKDNLFWASCAGWNENRASNWSYGDFGDIRSKVSHVFELSNDLASRYLINIWYDSSAESSKDDTHTYKRIESHYVYPIMLHFNHAVTKSDELMELISAYVKGKEFVKAPPPSLRDVYQEIATLEVELVYPIKNGDYAELESSHPHPSLTELDSSLKDEELSVESCLRKFCESEVLDENNTWYCPRCKDHVLATKTTNLWSLPEVLMIQLKRFMRKTGSTMHGTYYSFSGQKIEELVQYSAEKTLDLSPYLDPHPATQDTQYELFAVSNHSGSTAGGHYTAYAKNYRDGKWYYFNDSSVTLSNANRVCSESGYVLFYQRMHSS